MKIKTFGLVLNCYKSDYTNKRRWAFAIGDQGYAVDQDFTYFIDFILAVFTFLRFKAQGQGLSECLHCGGWFQPVDVNACFCKDSCHDEAIRKAGQ